jgi:tetratricopeptide (TPR) repeat protein
MSPAHQRLEDALSAFGEGAIGGMLDPAVDALIAQAGLVRDDGTQALALLEQARAAAPSHPAPLIALYRFYFYGHELAKARAVGEDALAIARTALGPDFGDVPPSDDDARHDAAVRFYLFALKGLAYLNMRMADYNEARTLLAELRRLDPNDRVGGALLAHVLLRHEQGPGPAGSDPPAEYPVRGWAHG